MSILLFAEDPGAVNCIAPLVGALHQAGNSVKFLSSGHATTLLQDEGFSPLHVENGEEAISELHSYSPSVVLVGTSENVDSPGLALISAAKKKKIKSIGVIDFFANAEFRFRGRTTNPLSFAPDWLVVPNNWTAKEYESLGFPSENIYIAGHPHYDFLIQQKAVFEKNMDSFRLNFPGIRPGQFVLVFASELSTGLNAQQYQRSQEYTLAGRGHHHGRTEIVIEELLDAIDTLCKEGVARPYLILRRHPKENATDLEHYLSSFNWVSNSGDPLALIYSADAVVGMSSMLLLESYILGTPVLSILPRETEQSWLPLTKMKNILCATRREEVKECLRTLLGASNFSASCEVKFEHLIGATQRIIEFLQQGEILTKGGSSVCPPALA